MSRGHAASKELVTWKNLPVAIPEIISKDTTTWIYSGSAEDQPGPVLPP